MNRQEFTVQNLTHLPQLAKKIIEAMDHSRVWGFYGEMGAGKTTLIKEVCRQLKVTDNVTSPSFALVNEYRTISLESIYHFDFYRINDIHEAFDLGYEEYFYSGNLCLIEWPEKISELLPPQMGYVWLTKTGNDSRTAFIEFRT
jgi:tRNA threonylcarbamoyladenosine biosynthesis protein TsaE